MSTYIICLDGRFHAVGMNLFADTVYSLESSARRSGIRTTAERNDAIRAVSSPMTWRDAYKLARRSGKYIGQLFTDDKHIM